MSDNSPDVSKVKSWYQVIAFGFVIFLQIVLGLRIETAHYSIIAVAILSFVIIYFIHAQGKTNREKGKLFGLGKYTLGNLEGMREFLREKQVERENNSDPTRCNFLDQICNEIQLRIFSLERMYTEMKKD